VGQSTKTLTAPSTDELVRTSVDMTNMYKWEHGDVLRGTHAKANPAMKRYRKDINSGWGQQRKYKDIYVDTFTQDLTISEQLSKK